jgi:hypothetical protein
VASTAKVSGCDFEVFGVDFWIYVMQRVEIQNCQTCLREAVARLVVKGVLDVMALEVVDGAPKN